MTIGSHRTAMVPAEVQAAPPKDAKINRNNAASALRPGSMNWRKNHELTH